MDACKPRSFLLLIALALPALVSCGTETPLPAEQPKQPTLQYAQSTGFGQVERRRATEAEAQAFVTKLNGGTMPRQLAAHELDGLLQRLGTTDDPGTRRALSGQFRAALLAMPSEQERKEAIRRYSLASPKATMKPLAPPIQPNVPPTTF